MGQNCGHVIMTCPDLFLSALEFRSIQNIILQSHSADLPGSPHTESLKATVIKQFINPVLSHSKILSNF